MKFSRNTTYLLYAALLMAPATVMAQDCHDVKLAANKIQVSNVQVVHQDNFVTVAMDLMLDSLNLPSNSQLIYTPMVLSQQWKFKLPEIVINGRRQQIMYERGVNNKRMQLSPKALVVRRKNHTQQLVQYQATIPLSEQIKNFDLNMHEDLCGCGDLEGGNDFTLRKASPASGSVPLSGGGGGEDTPSGQACLHRLPGRQDRTPCRLSSQPSPAGQHHQHHQCAEGR